jgi:hypothetical protein
VKFIIHAFMNEIIHELDNGSTVFMNSSCIFSIIFYSIDVYMARCTICEIRKYFIQYKELSK